MTIQGNLSERIHLRVDKQTKNRVRLFSAERRMTQKQVIMLALDQLFAT
jgi:hypothetical protein